MGFEGLFIPSVVKHKKVTLLFQSRTFMGEEENLEFNLMNKGEHVYSGEVDLNIFNEMLIYDVYVCIYLENRVDKFRINKNTLKSFKCTNENLFFTQNDNLSYSSINLKGSTIHLTGDSIKLTVLPNNADLNMSIFLVERNTERRIEFVRENNCWHLPYSFFYDYSTSTFDFYLEINNQTYRLANSMVKEISTNKLQLDKKVFCNLYLTDKKNISLKFINKSYSTLRRIANAII
ncbi:hypothetical protein [Paracerasibacillus soli]|uniref:Uncharacterized protein n=1 Tax=Paracerasibacillus soli TaxID=480284 RepID=A0ABU5CSP5_9BACI|nr:hypothetical protein [Virgibacillus soli]MDY0409351.1 hypothetical protein [Virgibacillus soli]